MRKFLFIWACWMVGMFSLWGGIQLMLLIAEHFRPVVVEVTLITMVATGAAALFHFSHD